MSHVTSYCEVICFLIFPQILRTTTGNETTARALCASTGLTFSVEWLLVLKLLLTPTQMSPFTFHRIETQLHQIWGTTSWFRGLYWNCSFWPLTFCFQSCRAAPALALPIWAAPSRWMAAPLLVDVSWLSFKCFVLHRSSSKVEQRPSLLEEPGCGKL